MCYGLTVYWKMEKMSGYCMLNKNEYDNISPMLSVIIPVYNVEPYIRQCLDSLVNQTFKDIEIICIDDGSSDNSGTICDEYSRQNNDVTFKIIHKKNEGVVKARNDGINVANGKYLTFVDSDDWVDKDFYERIFAALDNRKADVFCSGGRYIEYSKSTKMEKLLDVPFFYQKGEHRAEIIARTLVGWPTGKNNTYLYDFGYNGDKIFKTSFVKKVAFDNNSASYPIWEDALLMLRLFSNAETIGGCLEVGYHYRQDVPNSAVTKYRKNLPDICCHWADDAYRVIEKDTAFNETVLRDAFYARCQTMLVSSITQYFTHINNNAPYRQKAKEYRNFKNNKYFREALHHWTPYITSKINLKITVMRFSGLWSQYFINWVRSILKKKPK